MVKVRLGPSANHGTQTGEGVLVGVHVPDRGGERMRVGGGGSGNAAMAMATHGLGVGWW